MPSDKADPSMEPDGLPPQQVEGSKAMEPDRLPPQQAEGSKAVEPDPLPPQQVEGSKAMEPDRLSPRQVEGSKAKEPDRLPPQQVEGSKALLERIHVVCEQFEDLWQSGEEPSLASCLDGWQGDDRAVLFQYLLELDLDYRGQRGDVVTLEGYRQQFPDLTELLNKSPHFDTERGSADSVRSVHVASQTPSALEPLSRIANYEILDEVARGGMGIVYKARQINADRIVALKMILQGQFADDGDIARFHTEARAAARLDHPCIVPVFEVGESDGSHFFSMGFVDGVNLSERLSNGPLTSRDAATMLRHIVDAVAYAHKRGVIHRDLKPANVLLDADGLPRVTDFGLAKQMDANSELTATGQIMGTPQFMPPEQATGEADDIGPRSDVYSLGAILYTMLTGRPPFQAANIMDVLHQVCREEPVSPGRLAPSIDRDLETVCLKCLEKDIHRRYESAEALSADLSRFLAGEPISARPISGPERVARWCRRNRLVAGLIAAVALLLIGGSATSTWFAIESNQRAHEANTNFQRSEMERERADENLALAEERERLANKYLALAKSNEAKATEQAKVAIEQRDRANRQQRIAEVREYVGKIRLALREIEDRSIGKARETLASTNPQLRSWEYWHLLGLCNLQMQNFVGHGKESASKEEMFVKQVAFSPNGSLIGSGGTDGTLRIWDASQGRELHRIQAARIANTDEGRVFDLAFSPDGKLVVACGGFQSQGAMSVVDVSTGNVVAETQHDSLIFSVAFHPNSLEVATLDSLGSVRTWNAHTLEPIHETYVRDAAEELRRTLLANGETPTDQVQQLNARLRDLVYTSDGNHLLIRSSYGVHWTSTDGLKIIKSHGGLRLSQATSSNLALDSKRGQYAVGSVDGFVRFFDIQTGAMQDAFQVDQNGILELAYSPDDQTLVFAGQGGVKAYSLERQTVIETLDSRPEGWEVERHTIGALAYDPRAKRILTGSSDGVLRMWAITAPSSSRLLEIEENNTISFAMDHDGKRLVTCGPYEQIHGRAVVWDLDTREPTQTYQRNRSAIGMAAFSPNGLLLAVASKASSGQFLIEVWRTSDKRQLYMFEAPTPVVTFTADSQYLVAGDVMMNMDDGTRTDPTSEARTAKLGAQSRFAMIQQDQVRLYDASSQELLKTIPTPIQQIRTVAVTRDGGKVVVGGKPAAGGPSLCVFDAETGDLISTLPGDPKWIMSVAVTADGKRILSAGLGGAIRLFDTETLEPVYEMEAIQNLFQVGLSENQRWIAALGRLGGRQELRLWEAPLAPDDTNGNADPKPAEVIAH